MAAKKKQTATQKPSSSSMYYNIDNDLYVSTKKNILSAKSGILISRNFALRNLEYEKKEEEIKAEIKKNLSKITLQFREIKQNLPSIPVSQQIKKKTPEKKLVETKSKEEVPKNSQTEIDYELQEINQKLKELSNL